MRTIKVQYTTKEGTFFADVPVMENVYVDQMKRHIEKYLKEKFGEIISWDIIKFYN